MPLQPFGPAFEIDSPMSPAQVKARIRGAAKGWFERKTGARGWIIGSVVCLWWTAVDPRGPMLLGRISPSGAGSRIAGRAGSDLNGVAYATVITVVVLLGMLVRAAPGSEDFGAALTNVGLVAALLIPIWLLGAWMRQSMHADAEPLVRFLRNTVIPSSRTASRAAKRSLTLTINEIARFGPVSAADLHDALSGTGPDDVLILESAPQDYIQTAWNDGGFVLERREGGADRHFRAEGLDGGVTVGFEDALAAFTAYAEDGAMPSHLTWKALRLQD